MFDQSYSVKNLAAQLQRKDFRKFTPLLLDPYREQVVRSALKSADTAFHGSNPIRKFHLKGKPAYAVDALEDELVVRKLVANMARLKMVRGRGRDFIVKSLQRLLEEGVPYRVYRIDIRNFYESVTEIHIAEFLMAHPALDPRSKHLLSSLLSHFRACGGSGVPRGMALSAVLADMAMQQFDRALGNFEEVFFYARYVDDILVVTSGAEREKDFMKAVTHALPAGMQLNEAKTAGLDAVNLPKKDAAKYVGSLEYLGYKFLVFNPVAGARPNFRRVDIEIADAKLARIKKRIARSFLQFRSDGNFAMLHDRLRLLTSNFSITDVNSGGKKLAGVYHGYPRLTSMDGLRDLDVFLRSCLLGGQGRSLGAVRNSLGSNQRRMLLGVSFLKGFQTRRFVHFHPAHIGELQKCWIYD